MVAAVIGPVRVFLFGRRSCLIITVIWTAHHFNGRGCSTTNSFHLLFSEFWRSWLNWNNVLGIFSWFDNGQFSDIPGTKKNKIITNVKSNYTLYHSSKVSCKNYIFSLKKKKMSFITKFIYFIWTKYLNLSRFKNDGIFPIFFWYPKTRLQYLGSVEKTSLHTIEFYDLTILIAFKVDNGDNIILPSCKK